MIIGLAVAWGVALCNMHAVQYSASCWLGLSQNRRHMLSHHSSMGEAPQLATEVCA